MFPLIFTSNVFVTIRCPGFIQLRCPRAYVYDGFLNRIRIPYYLLCWKDGFGAGNLSFGLVGVR